MLQSCYALISIYNAGSLNHNQLYLLSLSLTEILISLLRFLTEMTDFLDYQSVNDYIVPFSSTGVYLIYFLNMFYLTIDKLFEILLNIRYPVYWNERKTKVLLVLTWLSGLLLSIAVTIVTQIKFFDYWVVLEYIYPAVDFSFLFVAFTTYGFLFQKFRRTRISPTDGKKRLSIWKAFRQSTFYVTILLVSSFIFFVVIPDLIFLFYPMVNRGFPESLNSVCILMYSVSFLIDAWIFMMMQRQVKRFLWKFVCSKRYNQQRSKSAVSNISIISMNTI